MDLDINNRIERHNAGKESFTSKGLPWQEIWRTKKNSRSEALILEKKLKNLSREKLIKFMMKYKESIAGPDAMILLDQWSGC